MFSQFIFHFFAVLLLFFASVVVTVRNPVHAALSLVLCFFFMAGIWLLLLAEFLAVVLVLVYVGAVMVLFLFVVMLLDVNLSVLRAGFVRGLPLGLAVALLMAFALSWLWLPSEMRFAESLLPLTQSGSVDNLVPEGGNTAALGKVLYTEYLYAFEIAGALLLLAIIAAITLTLDTGERKRKLLDPDSQVQATKRGRLRIISLPKRGGAAQASTEPQPSAAASPLEDGAAEDDESVPAPAQQQGTDEDGEDQRR